MELLVFTIIQATFNFKFTASLYFIVTSWLNDCEDMKLVVPTHVVFVLLIPQYNPCISIYIISSVLYIYTETINNKIIKSSHKENFISTNIADELKVQSPKSPHFHLKPELHKKGIPGRPAITSVNCNTCKISEYLDYHLQTILKEVPFYHKDKKSLNVKSLYTSISDVQGLTKL